MGDAQNVSIMCDTYVRLSNAAYLELWRTYVLLSNTETLKTFDMCAEHAVLLQITTYTSVQAPFFSGNRVRYKFSLQILQIFCKVLQIHFV